MKKNRTDPKLFWTVLYNIIDINNISSVFSQTIAPSGLIKMYELLHRITGEGLAVEYCFSRQPFSPDPNMVAVQIQFTNNTNSETKSLHIEEPRLQSGMRIREFAEIGLQHSTVWDFPQKLRLLQVYFCSVCIVLSDVLAAGDSVTVVMGIDFCDSTQAANFQLWWVFKKKATL